MRHFFARRSRAHAPETTVFLAHPEASAIMLSDEGEHKTLLRLRQGDTIVEAEIADPGKLANELAETGEWVRAGGPRSD